MLSSSGDLGRLVPGYEGHIAVDRGPAMVTLSSLAIPRDWLASIESDGEGSALRINAQPAKGSAAASRATLSLVLPSGTKLGLVPPGGSEIRSVANQTTSTIITAPILDLSIQFDCKEDEVFGSLAVRTISLQQIRRRFDKDSGQKRAEFGGSVRQASLWIDADRESPRALTPIDRLRLGGLRDAVMKVRVDGSVMEIVLRGRAAESRTARATGR